MVKQRCDAVPTDNGCCCHQLVQRECLKLSLTSMKLCFTRRNSTKLCFNKMKICFRCKVTACNRALGSAVQGASINFTEVQLTQTFSANARPSILELTKTLNSASWGARHNSLSVTTNKSRLPSRLDSLIHQLTDWRVIVGGNAVRRRADEGYRAVSGDVISGHPHSQ